MEKLKTTRDPFNPTPVGEPVNPYVHRIAPEPAPDYAAIQRSIERFSLVAQPKEKQVKRG
jgi:hypothetical protein